MRIGMWADIVFWGR